MTLTPATALTLTSRATSARRRSTPVTSSMIHPKTTTSGKTPTSVDGEGLTVPRALRYRTSLPAVLPLTQAPGPAIEAPISTALATAI